jgi:hypothetical protein
LRHDLGPGLLALLRQQPRQLITVLRDAACLLLGGFCRLLSPRFCSQPSNSEPLTLALSRPVFGHHATPLIAPEPSGAK